MSRDLKWSGIFKFVVHWRAIFFLSLFLCLTISLEHGYSTGYWREYTGSHAREPHIGSLQQDRSDDIVVQIPLALAQVNHRPPFPVVNKNIGYGVNMLVPYGLPVYHVVGIFRRRHGDIGWEPTLDFRGNGGRKYSALLWECIWSPCY